MLVVLVATTMLTCAGFNDAVQEMQKGNKDPFSPYLVEKSKALKQVHDEDLRGEWGPLNRRDAQHTTPRQLVERLGDTITAARIVCSAHPELGFSEVSRDAAMTAITATQPARRDPRRLGRDRRCTRRNSLPEAGRSGGLINGLLPYSRTKRRNPGCTGREVALPLMKAVMSKFMFGIHTKDGRH